MAILAVVAVWEDLYPEPKPRCPNCGYLLDGPLHRDGVCASELDARTISDEELKKRRLHRQHKDVLGF